MPTVFGVEASTAPLTTVPTMSATWFSCRGSTSTYRVSPAVTETGNSQTPYIRFLAEALRTTSPAGTCAIRKPR
jgi:hypothetical protein